MLPLLKHQESQPHYSTANHLSYKQNIEGYIPWFLNKHTKNLTRKSSINLSPMFYLSFCTQFLCLRKTRNIPSEFVCYPSTDKTTTHASKGKHSNCDSVKESGCLICHVLTIVAFSVSKPYKLFYHLITVTKIL